MWFANTGIAYLIAAFYKRAHETAVKTSFFFQISILAT